jgi:outer membrane protein OmpA-like peptidoglycan-associated protein
MLHKLHRKTSFLPTLLLMAAVIMLPACQTTTKTEKLTRDQISTLLSFGFTETDEGWELNLDSRLLFDSSSAELNAKEKTSLDKIAQTLLMIGITDIIIEGHTDNTGSERYNRELSRKRAEMVAQYLAERGMLLEKMEIKGMGSDNPVASNNTAGGRRENRRTVIIVPSQ